MQFQRMYENGKWYDEQDTDRFIDLVLAREPKIAPRYNRASLTTKTEVLNFLASGQILSYGSDWYAKVRDGAAFTIPQRSPEMVQCDCGHTVEKGLIMTANLGTTCPDCYDKLSD